MRAEYAKLLSSAPILPVSAPPVTKPLKRLVSHSSGMPQHSRLATESPGQAAVQIEVHAGHRSIRELKLSGRQKPGEGEGDLVTTGLEHERIAAQVKPMPAQIKFHEVVQQPEFVSRTATTVQLNEVPKIGCECVARKNQATTNQLELIQIGIVASGIEECLPELPQPIQSQQERCPGGIDARVRSSWQSQNRDRSPR